MNDTTHPKLTRRAVLAGMGGGIVWPLLQQPRTLVVAQDGSTPYSTVQAAIDAIPAARGTERVIIHIKPGTYKGPILLSPSKSFVTFRGESAEKTILTNDWSARKLKPDGTPYGTSGSTSVLLEGNDFHAENITFENSAGRGRDVGQAVAVKVASDRAIFRNCRFVGWQDTLYPNGAESRQYFRDCYIEGDVDFIFGSAAAVFERCHIHSKGPGYITAQSRLTPEAIGGYVFRDCNLTAAPDVPEGSVYLGRPWRPYARVIFIGCNLGKHIRPEGWHNWNKPEAEKTAWYAEADCKGPGASTTSRVSWAHRLTAADVGEFETRRFLSGKDNWNPTMSLRPDEPIRIMPGDTVKLDFSRTDGGLPLANTQTFVICKADREHPAQSDGRGWTYHHHTDLACWKGRLYVGWNSCERDEDTWPSRELYSTSTDGEHWTPPAELFPEGASTPLRMYFYHAANGMMLAIAGLRATRERLTERIKGPLVVREIRADHTLGPVFTLRPPETEVSGISPLFDTAKDSKFITACRELLANRVFLQQQDYGNLLPPAERIKWNTPANWEGDDQLRKDAAEFGKAMCFYHQADGTLVGISKRRWVTTSPDNGKTWTQPVRPSTFINGGGKAWCQKTPTGGYILCYNPDLSIRYPMAVVTSEDGVTFRDMRSLHGELPKTRYPGLYKDPGASYIRGLSEWSNDGSRKDSVVWLVYSVNKEEIWITRLAV